MKTNTSAFEFSQMLSCVIEDNTGSEHFDNQRSGFEVPSFRIHDMIKFGTAVASIFNKQVIKPDADFSINIACLMYQYLKLSSIKKSSFLIKKMRIFDLNHVVNLPCIVLLVRRCKLDFYLHMHHLLAPHLARIYYH